MNGSERCAVRAGLMRHWTWLLVAAAGAPGCYRSHLLETEDAAVVDQSQADVSLDAFTSDGGPDAFTPDAGPDQALFDLGPDLATDFGFPVQGVIVQRQHAPRPAEPVAGARVLVEDCETGVVHEAETNGAGVAMVRDDGATCWNVTAVFGDDARSVLGAPVPLPGPIVFPYEPETGSVMVPWMVSLDDYAGGFVTVDVPGTTMALGARGLAARDAVARSGLATLVIAEPSAPLRGALVQLREQGDGSWLGEADLPLPATATHAAELIVRTPREWEHYPEWRQRPIVDTPSVVRVRRLSQGGAAFAVGPRVGVDRAPSFEDYSHSVTLGWVDIPGTEAWSQPFGLGFDGPVRWRDTCARPLIAWSDVVLVDGDRLEIEIPSFSAREIAGDSLETMRIRIGSPGHRTRVVLRTPGPTPFEWTIEPFALGAVEVAGVPPLPAGVAEQVRLFDESVYVQVGSASPEASYDPVDATARTPAWWVREGFVFGRAADFDGVVASCPVRGPR